MSDPSSMERYCSSYYDKHGLYNDGFPCPSDKYCCQTSDGAKMCCPIQASTSDSSANVDYSIRRAHHKTSATSTQAILTTLLNHNKHNKYNMIVSSNRNDNFNSLDTDYADVSSSSNILIQSSNQMPSSSSILLSSASSAMPFFLSNSNLIIGICIALALLILLIIVLSVCVCRCCRTNESKNEKASKKKLDEESNHLHHQSQIFQQQSTLKKKPQKSSNPNSSFSRNSSSSCNSTTVTSSASTSPKTNELTLFCHDDDHDVNESQKILTIDAGNHHHHLNHHHQRNHLNPNINSFMSNNHHGNHINQMHSSSNSHHSHNLNHQNPYGLLNGIISSGSTSNSTSTCTTTSSSNAALILNSQLNLTSNSSTIQQALYPQQMLMNANDLEFNENDEDIIDNCLNDDEENEDDGNENDEDFIVSTSSNLEFLKSHSLFNSTPLNYYPSLSANGNISASHLQQLQQLQSLQMNANTNNHLATIKSNASSTNSNNNLIDYRFSTFQPIPQQQSQPHANQQIYANKNHEIV